MKLLSDLETLKNNNDNIVDIEVKPVNVNRREKKVTDWDIKVVVREGHNLSAVIFKLDILVYSLDYIKARRGTEGGIMVLTDTGETCYIAVEIAK